MTSSKRRGLVIARHRREVRIEGEDGDTFTALVRGRNLRPLAGDRVLFRLESDGTAVLHEICPRVSLLERIDSRGRGEGVAANVSLLVVVIAPQPAPDWQLVDRYLVAAALMGIDAGLARNKQDTVDIAVDTRADAYREIGYELAATSTKNGHGLEMLAHMLAGKRGVLVGQSGVGKSSLINALLGEDAQPVGDLSHRKALGRHTTTAAMLFRLPGGGELIDSPGVRRYAPNISDPSELPFGFIEFRPYLDECRFSDCAHLTEPGCAITEAVNAGKIRAERYRSYCTMRTTLTSLKER
jgi:ribosome biogenesis GTPase / thiamine phosphate phosphatase